MSSGLATCFPGVHQKVVEVDYQDDSTHCSVFPMLRTDSSDKAKLFRSLPFWVKGISRTAWDPTRQGMWLQLPTQTEGVPTTLPRAPHPLPLPIWGQQPHTHHVVVFLFDPSQSIGHKTTGASFSSKPSLKPVAKRGLPLDLAVPLGAWLASNVWVTRVPPIRLQFA